MGGMGAKKPFYNVFDGGEWADWREITMADFAQHVQGKQIIGSTHVCYISRDLDVEGSGIVLSDNSAVVAQSCWSGPYSSQTPDVDAEEPKYFLSTTRKELPDREDE